MSQAQENLNRALYTSLKGLRLDEANRLIKKGADPNAVRGGAPLLHLLVKNLKKDTQAQAFALLLEAGANPNELHDERPLLSAILHYSSDERAVAAIESLVQHGVDLDVRFFDGKTALHDAIKNNRPKSAAKLIEVGVDLNAEDSQGFRPLHVAHVVGDDDTKRLLKSAGAKRGLLTFKRATQVYATQQAENDRKVRELFRSTGMSALRVSIQEVFADASEY